MGRGVRHSWYSARTGKRQSRPSGGIDLTRAVALFTRDRVEAIVSGAVTGRVLFSILGRQRDVEMQERPPFKVQQRATSPGGGLLPELLFLSADVHCCASRRHGKGRGKNNALVSSFYGIFFHNLR